MGIQLVLVLKGIAMGAANVIPGVSGGTIAFVTGIYGQLIDSLKSFDVQALRVLSKGEFAELSRHLQLSFLIPLFFGIGLSLISLGKLLDWLFLDYPTPVWSFFFGLILASIFYVSKNIRRWSFPVIASFAIGVAIALLLAFVKPAEQNESFLYIAVCGIVAICSMILPGLSGSFVLILMGNYQLVMLQAVPSLNFKVIIPFAVGGGIGFILLSHIIAFLLRKFHDATLSLLTGFILGSLAIIWPWKREVYLTDDLGELLLKKGEKIVQGYQWYTPDLSNGSTWFALALMVAGIGAVMLLERSAKPT